MKVTNPKITFDLDYLRQVAILHAEQIEMFKGQDLVSSIEIDHHDLVVGISVSLKDGGSNQ